MSSRYVIFLVSILFGFCESGFVDTLVPCSIYNSECLTNLYQSILQKSSENGIPELDIPLTDPYKVQNQSARVLDLIEISMIKGEARGIRSCKIHKVFANLDTKNFTMDFTCNLVIEGKYAVSSSPLVKPLIGGSVHGEGNGKVEIEKVRIRASFEFFVRKDKDGEIYFDYKYEGMRFAFTFGKVKLYGDNLYIGDAELSKPVLRIINSNWKFFLTTFGGPFVQKGMDIFFKHTHQFYDNVPAKKFIIEDMTPYL